VIGSDEVRALAIQEKDLSLQWRKGKGRLLYVKLKKSKTLEAWVNQQITKENIHEITQLRILKNGRTLNLDIDTSKTRFKPSLSGEYEAPAFYVKTEIRKEDYERIMNGKRAIQ